VVERRANNGERLKTTVYPIPVLGSPGDSFKHKKFLGLNREPENCHFSFLAAPASEVWVVLSSPRL